MNIKTSNTVIVRNPDELGDYIVELYYMTGMSPEEIIIHLGILLETAKEALPPINNETRH